MNIVEKAKQVGVEMYQGATMTLKVVYLACAVYGAYQIVLKFDKLGQVLEIAQK